MMFLHLRFLWKGDGFRLKACSPKVQPKLAILTHMGMKMIAYPPEKKAAEIEEETGVKVVAATDGMRLLSDQF